ncbi:MAG: glycosyltransferase family 4 protein [Chloroflexi bacterium]|nr:glycosyltransferase family 4 protein [Chloroflexota bacterium]
MKIALVSPYDFTYPGGVTSHIVPLAQQFQRAGHHVSILAPSSRPVALSAGMSFVRLGQPVLVPTGGSVARISLSVWLLPKVKQLLEETRFDVVHLHEPFTPFVPICVLHYSNALNVATFHAYHGRSKLYPFTKQVLHRWASRLHGRIAVSQPAAEFVGRYFPGDYRVIPNGIDVDRFSDRALPLPQFMDGRLNLLFVGRMEKRKGLRYLLGAYSRLKWDFPNLRLIVVGPGTPDKESYRILGSRGLQDVVFLGGVPNEELPRYYRSAHIFCAPATGKESFGIVLLEAMASGCPIVASNIEGYSAVVDDGVQGLLVPPKSEEALAAALRLLIESAPLRYRFGLAGQQKAQLYRWERVALRVLDYYDELRAERGQRELSVALRAR